MISAREEACVRIQQALTMFPGGECALQLQAQVGPMPACSPNDASESQLCSQSICGA